MFSDNFQRLLDPPNREAPTLLGNERKIGRGIRINTNDSATLDSSWCVRDGAEYAHYGREGRFVEFRISDVEGVTRKTVSFVDSSHPEKGENQHFLYVARAETPTRVLVSVASRAKSGQKYVNIARGYQAIGKVPTALVINVPAPEHEPFSPRDSHYRFNMTFETPGALAFQLLDVRYCTT